MMNKFTPIPTLILILFLVCQCGTEGDIFGSLDNVPSSGVAPFTKVDLDPVAELVQPFVLIPVEADMEYKEPSVIRRDGQFLMWVEQAFFTGENHDKRCTRSQILHYHSADGLHWEEASIQPVLVADLAWENEFVGAPSVLHKDGLFHMWYAGGLGEGIGYAQSTDGIVWSKEETPVLLPSLPWEKGTVYAPCVLYNHGKYRMWYSAGNSGIGIGESTGNAIGYAFSVDGFTWLKQGPNDEVEAGSDAVTPVLTATQPWEVTQPLSVEQGFVSSPTVFVDQTIQRKIYRMWYTGNIPGELFFHDASIGYAGSLDGRNWEKAEGLINPVLQELFPLNFEGITDYFPYDECQPTVLHHHGTNFMWYIQQDPLNFMQYGLRGVSVATNPPVDLQR